MQRTSWGGVEGLRPQVEAAADAGFVQVRELSAVERVERRLHTCGTRKDEERVHKMNMADTHVALTRTTSRLSSINSGCVLAHRNSRQLSIFLAQRHTAFIGLQRSRTLCICDGRPHGSVLGDS